LQCNFVIIEATYIVYWFGECFFFVGSLIATCYCFVLDSTCASAFRHFRVSFHAIVSFSIPCLLFSVCSLQVRMFAYLQWHGCRMFPVPSVLRLQFCNRWRYICYLLARWFLLVRWFVGFRFYLFGPGLHFRAFGVQFNMFVLSRWFGACCFLLFDSALQGWGPAPMVGAFFLFFLDCYCFLGRFTVFSPCTHEWTCSCAIFPFYRGQYLFYCEILLVL
jgi:hypothetical protein